MRNRDGVAFVALFVYYLNFARSTDFRAIGSFFGFRRLNIQLQDYVHYIT